MNLSSALRNPREINFDFITDYMGRKITLSVVSNSDRYSVLHENKTIGHIKLGEIRQHLVRG